MDGADLAFAGIARQAELIRAGEVSSRELTELYLGRIERLGPAAQRVYRIVCGERALAEADAADVAGRRRRGAAARRAARDQGQRRRGGRRYAVRHRRVRPAGRRRRPAGRAAARGGRGDPRQDEPSRAGDLRLHRVETWGVTRNPWDLSAARRGLQRRQRRRGRRRAGRSRDGLRRRRLDPDPGGLLRPLRPEAAAGPGADDARPTTGTGSRSPAASRGPSPTPRSSST